MRPINTDRREFIKLGMATLAIPGKASSAPPSVSEEDNGQPSAEVVIYPAPAGEVLSRDYEVQVNGRQVPVYAIRSQWHEKKYSAAYFDFAGDVKVWVRPNLEALGLSGLEKLAIRPAKDGLKPDVLRDGVGFTTDRPFNLSVEPNGQNSPLHLFSNRLEKNPPHAGDPNVIYFGPGVHKPVRIDLTSGQTLYIAGGAVVKSAVTSMGDNIRIIGRGILCGNDWEHSKGPTARMVWPMDGNNILIEDILIRGSWNWTIAPSRCDQVLIQNLRICGSRCGNDDGIDPCNSSNVTIRNCFVHTDDDGIAIKGTAETGQEPKTTENILIEDCTFWIDFANGFRIGAESRAYACRNIVARNIDFIHFPNRPNVNIFYLHPTDNMPMTNLTFENIRINGESPLNLIRLEPQLPQARKANSPVHRVVAGNGPYIHNVTFQNIEVYGRSAGGPTPRVLLQGLTALHDVANIELNDVSLYGEKLVSTSPAVQLGPWLRHVSFDGLSAALPSATK